MCTSVYVHLCVNFVWVRGCVYICMYITHRHAYKCACTHTCQVSAREWMHAERFAWEKMGQPLGDDGNPVTLIDCLDAHTLHPRSVLQKQLLGAITQRVASRK